jgi:hypothetical protein
MDLELFAGATYLGNIRAKIIDSTMGVIGGMLQPSDAYINQFQPFFRLHSEKSHWEIDWEEIRALKLKAISQVSGGIIQAAGGICITDDEGFDEISIEVCGVDLAILMPDLFSSQE